MAAGSEGFRDNRVKLLLKPQDRTILTATVPALAFGLQIFCVDMAVENGIGEIQLSTVTQRAENSGLMHVRRSLDLYWPSRNQVVLGTRGC